jgi:hypothetical protein
MLEAQVYEKYWQAGISYTQYAMEMKHAVEHPAGTEYDGYIPHNYSRMTRIAKTVKLTEELVYKLQQQNHTKWLVITEHWCGDASQIVSVLDAMQAASNDTIPRCRYNIDRRPPY